MKKTKLYQLEFFFSIYNECFIHVHFEKKNDKLLQVKAVPCPFAVAEF